MKTKLFNQDKRPLKAQKISKEEIEKTRLEKVYQNFLFIRLKIKDDKNVRLEVRL